MNVDIHQNQKSKLPESTGNIAVVYARYSSHNQTEQSIEGQLAAAHAYAEVKGYTIIHEYIDRAKTGRNDCRDDFQQMLADCAKKQFQVIIVWKVDRFGRNREEITFNKYRAKRHGVRVEYVAENLPESPEGVILESVLEGMAEYYSLQLSQNVKRGLRENYKKGKIMGGRLPLGYRASPQKTYEIDPDTAPIVQGIFESYLSGATCAEICRDLNQKGVRTAQGGEFNKNSLRSILSNKKYIGIYEHGPDKAVTEGAIPPLISVEVFERVQDLMRINQKTPSKAWYKTDYLLADKIFCGRCGSPMTGESGFGRAQRRYSYYLCREHKRGGNCKAKAIRQSFIEPFIVRFTLDLLNDDELLNEVIDRTWAYYKIKAGDDSKQRALQSQINGVQTSIRNLLRAVEAGFFSEATQVRMAELEAQKTALEASLAELNLNAENGLTREKIEFFLYSLRSLDYEDHDCQKRLIKIFINSVYVYDDYLILNYNYSSDSRVIRLDEIEDEDIPDAGEMIEGDTIVPENGGCFDCRASLPVTSGRNLGNRDFFPFSFPRQKLPGSGRRSPFRRWISPRRSGTIKADRETGRKRNEVEDMKTIGERIAELRREKGLTQEALGETIGVSAQTVSKWENSNTAPDISLLPVLADVFGTSIDGLFGREGRRKDVSFEEFPELCFDALLKTYAECWCSDSSDNTAPADMIRAIRENGQTNSGVAADSGASVLLWRDFACVSHEKDEDVLPLLDKDLLDDFFATLARPTFRHIVRVLIETESPADKLQPPAFTSASLAKKCGLSVEETERELTALGRYGFVQIMEQTIDMDEAPLKVYSRWGRGSARLFLYPLILLADRFLTNRNHWRGFRG